MEYFKNPADRVSSTEFLAAPAGAKFWIRVNDPARATLGACVWAEAELLEGDGVGFDGGEVGRRMFCALDGRTRTVVTNHPIARRNPG